MSNTITTAAELDALPEGEAVVQTLGGLWIKGEGANWHRPLRAGETKVRSSTYLEQVGNLTLIWPRTAAPSVSRDQLGDAIELASKAAGAWDRDEFTHNVIRALGIEVEP